MTATVLAVIGSSDASSSCVDLHADFSFALFVLFGGATVSSRSPRNSAALPVRAISLMPIGSSRRISAPILSSSPVISTMHVSAATSTILARKMSAIVHHFGARRGISRDLDQSELALDVRRPRACRRPESTEYQLVRAA